MSRTIYQRLDRLRRSTGGCLAGYIVLVGLIPAIALTRLGLDLRATAAGLLLTSLTTAATVLSRGRAPALPRPRQQRAASPGHGPQEIS